MRLTTKESGSQSVVMDVIHSVKKKCGEKLVGERQASREHIEIKIIACKEK